MQDEVKDELDVQPIEVTWEELYKQFCLIFDSTDYEELYQIIRLRPYNFILRGKVKNEMKAIVLALWRLCLRTTFSAQSELYFTQAMIELKKSKRINDEIETIYGIYWGSLQKKFDADFSPPADTLRNRLRLDKRKIHTMTLALYMRSVYEYIREYLVDMSLEGNDDTMVS